MTASQTQPLSASQATDASTNRPVLEVRDLRVHYATPEGDVVAVNGVSFDVRRGEILGLVGESGCGKSTTAMAILRLVQAPGRIVGGHILLDGTDLVKVNERRLNAIRWRDVALIPQGAMNSLNPVMKVKDQQRVCIAMAIALNPSLIIADEPTSALDVVVQRVVAQTLLDVKRRLNVSMILIGHDMGLQAQLVDRVAVMYAGNIVEIAPVQAAFSEPLHPYTQLLIGAIPSIKERKPLKVTEGLTHDLRRPPPGCVFSLRCPHVADECRAIVPALREMKPDHLVACHRCENWLPAGPA